MSSKSRIISVATLFAALIAVAGCGNKGESADRAKGQGKSYTVRGVVDSAPAAGASELFVKHESIPGFINAFGETSTMKSMVMGFGVGTVTIDGLSRGDKVEMTFHTDWNAKPALQVDELAKLPADTALQLGDGAGGEHAGHGE